jgi:hypothetical protein
MTTTPYSRFALPLLLVAGVASQAAVYIHFNPAPASVAETETAVVALNPYTPPIVTKSEDRILPEEIPTEALLPVEEPVSVVLPAPSEPPKKKKHHHHHKSHRNHDAPQLITGVTTPISQNEEETMHPTRAYCTRLGNHKIGSALNEVCFERDMITGKIYKIPN